MPGRQTRPPERIDQILGNLSAYWKRHPDLRLGQILGNFASGYGEDSDDDRASDPYYYEDADLLARLRKENAK